MKAIDLFGVVLIMSIIIMSVITLFTWVNGQTLSPNWECTEWHTYGQKDHQGSTCDQYTRKEPRHEK